MELFLNKHLNIFCLHSRVTVLLYSALAAALFLLSLPSYCGQLDRDTYDRCTELFCIKVF